MENDERNAPSVFRIISLRLLLDEGGDDVGFNGLGKGDRSRGVASLFW
jgi:hypothetical protein